MRSLRLTAAASLTAAAGGKRPTLRIQAYNGGAIRPEAPRLDAPMVVDLAGVTAAPRCAITLGHDASAIIGQCVRVDVKEAGIEMHGVITGDHRRPGSPAALVLEHARNGFRWGASLEAQIGKLELVRGGATAAVNGRTFAGPLYVARGVHVRGVTLLGDPADDQTTVDIAARRAAGGTNVDDDRTSSGDGNDDNGDALLAAARREREKRRSSRRADPAALAQENLDRVENIRATAARWMNNPDADHVNIDRELNAALADDDCTAADFDRLLGRLSARSARGINNAPRAAAGGSAVSADVIGCGLMLAAGAPREHAERAYGARVAEQAEARRYGGWRDAICDLAALNGQRAPRGNPAQMLHDLRAAGGPSTYDLSGILGPLLHKSVAERFAEAPSLYPKIARMRPLNDFKAHAAYRLYAGGKAELLAPGGPLKDATLSESSQATTADTYGRIVRIDRRDVINDDLGALGEIPLLLARLCVLAVNDKFAQTLLDGIASGHFAAGNGNFDDGADSAFGVEALSAAISLMRKQTNQEGQSIDLMPKTIVAPPEQEAVVRAVLRSTSVARDVSSADLLPEGNPNPTDLEMAIEPRLSNTAFTGASTTGWFLFSSDRSAITAGFVGGKQSPTVEQVPMTDAFLGIGYRCFVDFGCSLGEPQGAVHFAGA